MWAFLKKILSKRDGKVTVLIIDDSEPDTSSTFRINSSDMVKLAVVVFVISVLLTTMIFFITPLGSLYQFRQEDALRQQVLNISEKIVALSDSLNTREQQLMDIQQILMNSPDTTFILQHSYDDMEYESAGNGYSSVRPQVTRTFDMLSQNEIIFSDILKKVPDFPTSYPIEGDVTQQFSVDTGHHGIDIAAREQTEFKAVADGTVVNAGWTINWGYVIYVQHADGYMSIYKHAARLFKKEGDIILKGDILGTIGNTGMLSFGSHLHFEIWKNGVSQDPLMYLIK